MIYITIGIIGIKANKAACEEYFENCPTAATELISTIGYAKVAEIITQVNKTGESYKQAAVRLGFVASDFFH